MNLVRKQRNIFLVVQVAGSQEVELAVSFAAGYSIGPLGQQYGPSILVRVVVGYGAGRVMA